MKVPAQKIQWLKEQALNIYPYGSMVYGTYVDGQSDQDFIVIVHDGYTSIDKAQWECNSEQYSIYTASTWREKLNHHDIDALECHFLPNWLIIKELMPFELDLKTSLIRQSISGTASNSWVKCKKKLTVQKDFAPRVGKKSLWHALRILDFGMQLMVHKRIIDYTSCNDYYDEIVNCKIDNWEYYKEKYQPIYNAMKSQFKEAHRFNADTTAELS